MAQNHMKQQEDKGDSEREFVEGEHVFLHLKPYKKTSLKYQHCQKFTPKFYGPYRILKRVGIVAYQLELSSHSKLHLAFHATFLKKVLGTRCQNHTILPKLDEEGSILLHPKVVLD
jgi:hypothetical protein